MSTSLFRQQAVDAKSSTLAGEAYLVSPLRFKVVALTALLAATGLLSIVAFGSYTKKETVVGYVTTTEGNVRVFPTAAGTISEIYISQGDEVVLGQALAKISTAVSTGGPESVQTSLLASVRQEGDALRKQIARTRELGRGQEAELREQIDNRLFQIGVIKEQRSTSVERLELARKNYRKVEDLQTKGLVSELDVDRSRAEALDLELELNKLDRELAVQRGVLGQMQRDLAQLPAVSANTVADLEMALQRVDQRITEISGEDAVVLVAPIDGVVSDLGRRIGQLISTETPFVTLLPNQTSYYAELYVPSRSIGFVNEGSAVQVRYDAYPYQKYGVYSCIVRRVATTPVRSHEADAPIQLVEPSYLLTVELNDQAILIDGGYQSLQAGMTLRADIVREKRRIIEWIFDPLVSAVQRTQ
jgi:membrane fusion protein